MDHRSIKIKYMTRLPLWHFFLPDGGKILYLSFFPLNASEPTCKTDNAVKNILIKIIKHVSNFSFDFLKKVDLHDEIIFH